MMLYILIKDKREYLFYKLGFHLKDSQYNIKYTNVLQVLNMK